MRRSMCESKIHRSTVTDANLAYDGGITLDPHRETPGAQLRIDPA